MANSIEFAKNYTGILDEVYQRAAISRCLNSGGRMVRVGRNAKKILIPKISVTILGDYSRNVSYKTGVITYEFETRSVGYDRAFRLFADVMDVEKSGILDCFMEASAELRRTQVAPEADVYTFSQIADTARVTTKAEDLSEAEAGDILSTMSREAPAFADFYSFAADAAGEGFDERLEALTRTTVGQLATREVYSVQADGDMRDVCAALSSRRLKKAPVMRGDRVVGVINRSNITRHAVERYRSAAD